MVSILAESRPLVRIPFHLDSLAAFRLWAKSPDYPAYGSFGFLAGELFVDLSMEQAFSHNQVKGEYSIVLGRLVKQPPPRGYYFHDRMLLTHLAAELSTEPDGMYVSYDSLQSGRIRLIEGAEEGYVELEGTADMVLEVVSTSSEEKDQVTLPVLYAKAGIPEFWRVDARGETPKFEILKLGPRGYVPVRKQAGGWLKSAVFGCSFRFTQFVDTLGHPQYSLEVR